MIIRKISEKKAELLSSVWDKFKLNPRFHICTKAMERCNLLDSNIMRLLRRREHMSIKEIANKLALKPSTLSSAIHRLEKYGFVRREICHLDLRSYQVSLTAKGLEAIEEFHAKELEVFNELLSKLENQDEQNLFLDLFNRVLD